MGKSGRNPVTVYLTDDQARWLDCQLGPGKSKSGVLLWMIEKQRSFMLGRGYPAEPNRPDSPMVSRARGSVRVMSDRVRSEPAPWEGESLDGDGPRFVSDPQ